MKKILLNGFSSLGFAIPILYEIFVLIDSWIYALAAFAMQAFFAIAKLQLSTENISDISYITSRIMLLCGVYALFKLSITLINCIIDPNKIEKSGKSGTKIVQRIVIAVVLLASSKFIFDELFAFQNVVIDSNVIPKIIYGDANYNDENDGDMALTSKKFVNSVFVTLFENNTAETSPSEAAKTAKNRVLQGESILLLSPYAYDAGFHYIPFVTGIVGILLCYYFIAFAFELGTRIIKLFVLQVISPIPIIMSIDPSSKSDKLVNFAKLYGGIYLNVFVRILTVYVAFVALNLVTSVFDGINWLAKILLIIGVFHAAKELPKLIEDALGMKLGLGDGGKGFGSILKGTIAGGAGLVGGAIAGGISGGAGGALGGAFTGLTTGVTKGAAAKNAVGVISAGTGAVKGAYGTGLKVRNADGIFGYGLGKIDNFTGRGTGIDRKVADAETKVNAYKTFEDAVYSDYATGDLDGIKHGKMDEDTGVIAAESLYAQYRNGQTVNLNGTTYDMTTSSNIQSDIQAFKTNIKKAQDTYKANAMQAFETIKIDSNGNELNSSGAATTKYSEMTESQKAHFELKRKTGSVLTKGNSTDLMAEFKTRNQNAKNDLKNAKDKQKEDRYRREKATGGK